MLNLRNSTEVIVSFLNMTIMRTGHCSFFIKANVYVNLFFFTQNILNIYFLSFNKLDFSFIFLCYPLTPNSDNDQIYNHNALWTLQNRGLIILFTADFRIIWA